MHRWTRSFGFLLLVSLLTLGTFAGAALAKITTLDPDVVQDIEVGKYGGTFTYPSLGAGPKTFNPYLAQETSTTDITDRIFDGLVGSHGRTTEVVPGLAKSWDVSEDQLQITFHLRRGVQWHDGVEFTADDVIFSYDLVYDQNIPNNFRDGLTIDGQPLKYEKIDKYTVRFTLPRVYAPILRSIGVPIVPKHKLYDAWQAGRFNEMWGLNTDVREIIGTGAWKLGEFVPGQRVVLVRNPNYWRVDKVGNALPYLDQVVMNFVENIDTQILQFRAGQADFAAPSGDQVAVLQSEAAAKGFRIISGGPTFGSEFIVFNQNPNTVPQPKLSWFTNKTFRQALAHALDKESIIDLVYAGLAVPQWSPISPAAKAFHKADVKTYEYDLEKAAALLSEAGFTKGADGVLRDPQGNPVEFDIRTNAGNTRRESIGRMFAEDLGKLGIKATLQPIDFNLLVRQLTETYDWDAIVIGLTGGVEPATGNNVWPSTGGLHMWYPRQQSPATDWEARIDYLFSEGTKYFDLEKRRVFYDEFQDIMADQVPLLFTVAPLAQYAVYNHIKNAAPTAYARGILYQLEELYIQR